MTDLLKRLAFMSQVAKNAGMSVKEAAESFKRFGASLKSTEDLSLQNNWPERIAPRNVWPNEPLDDQFFAEYQQQQITYTTNHVEIASTHTDQNDSITEEDIDRAKEAIDRIAEKTNEAMEQEMLTPDLSNVYRCPHCMRNTTWSFRDYNIQAVCNECQWEFDSWALLNTDFAELRTQVLELQLRQLEQEIERQVQVQAQVRRNTQTRMNMDMADEIRLLMQNRDLNAEQMQSLDELIGIAGNNPPERINVEFEPLSGQGISGDDVLMGNEEMLTMTGTTSRNDDERIEFSKPPKEKSVKPLVPPKRKLDI